MLVLAHAGLGAEPLSASAAAQRLQDGAQGWDLRAAGAALLPGAVRLTVGEQDDAATLARAVSAAGIDLSRDVLIYGEPGDARALALHARLARLASGRVDWLVGGLAEWQMSGRATVAAPAQRLPVPQRLVEPEASGRMAAAALRDLPAADENASTRLALR
jgi:3-mercaptopyruvate sulfurtransferase SseA